MQPSVELIWTNHVNIHVLDAEFLSICSIRHALMTRMFHGSNAQFLARTGGGWVLVDLSVTTGSEANVGRLPDRLNEEQHCHHADTFTREIPWSMSNALPSNKPPKAAGSSQRIASSSHSQSTPLRNHAAHALTMYLNGWRWALSLFFSSCRRLMLPTGSRSMECM
jgi:hypothetical protein